MNAQLEEINKLRLPVEDIDKLKLYHILDTILKEYFISDDPYDVIDNGTNTICKELQIHRTFDNSGIIKGIVYDMIMTQIEARDKISDIKHAIDSLIRFYKKM